VLARVHHEVPGRHAESHGLLPGVLDELVNGAVTKTYTYGLQRISENQLSGSTWTPTFYGYDGHGNVRFTTSTAGAVGNTYQFDAFGAPIASTGTIANTYLYSGERFDSNLNLYQLRARYYNMLTGRFETMDPWQHKSCCGSASCAPRNSSLYVYADGDPVNRIDPTGRDAEEYGEDLTPEIETKEPRRDLACYQLYLADTAYCYETFDLLSGGLQLCQLVAKVNYERCLFGDPGRTPLPGLPLN
jgi:RHS repeat-associated protein